MNNLIKNILKFKHNFLPSEILDDEFEKVPSLVEMVNKAKEEWLDAKRFFEEVTDPVLIDHAIYRMESAEKKYMYLLKLVNDEKVVNDYIQLN
ncbi:MAG: hypothetical protein PWQ67_2692 [Clostridia bacterium]|jgi:hypothetical protein|nr:hypothetical protein [Clostridia bacterium]MDN5324238.1 hypothetical protein [Clostridia bacterium]